MKFDAQAEKKLLMPETEQTTESLFEQYFEKNIVPLVEQDNYIKDKYRSRFWGYVWSITFLISVNVLFVLFMSLMSNHPVNFEQLFLFTLVASIFVVWPIFKYYREPREDIFDVFLKFYGQWQHKTTGEVSLVHSPIIPAHDAVRATHNITSEFDRVKVEIRDTYYTKQFHFLKKKWERTVSSGVIVYLTFPQKFSGTLLVFDKSGFYKSGKFSDLEVVKPRLEIPAANYFKCFTDNVDFAQNIMLTLFYETILDMKEAFGAKKLYIQIQDNYIRLYFEGSVLYFDSYKFWSRKIDKNKFLQINNEFEKTFNFIQMIKALIA